MSCTAPTSTALVWPTVYLGDDWSFPYSLTNPDGSPLDLTGASAQAQLFGKGQAAPVFSMSDSTSVVVAQPPTLGKVTFKVPRALTATLHADGCSDGYPSRIQVQLLDASGMLTTIRVDAVPVADARFVPLSG